MKVTVHKSWEEVQALAPEWNRLLAASASDTLFLTWEWCEAWWKNYGAGRPLYVLAAYDGNQLAGIAPLYVDKARRFGAGWKCLRFIGDGSHDSDYLDCFAQHGKEPETFAAFAEFLQDHRSEWDWMELESIPESSPCLASFLGFAESRQWRTTREPIPCAVLDLPATWDEYLGMLQARFRTKVRSCMAHFEQKLQSAPIECADESQIAEWLPALFDLHTRRWQQAGQSGVFGHAAKRSFYQDVSRAMLRRGWLAFHRLDWGERPLALQYGFRYANRFFLLQEGYDPAFDALRPGVALRGSLMRHWIDCGLAQYDFLAGSSSYKMEWGGRKKLSYKVLFAPKPLGATVVISAPRTREALKASARKVTPDWLLAWRKQSKTRHDQPAAKEPARPAIERALRWTASCVYTYSPVGSIVRNAASRYLLNGGISRRTTPVCHIFIYHRVNDDHDPFFGGMPVDEFRWQMTYLKKNFHFVSLDQLATGSLPEDEKYCVAVTFDDGYRDNCLHAFPVLQQLGIPATIFLATGYIDSGELTWYDRVRLGFKLTMRDRVSFAEMGGPELNLQSDRGRLEGLEKCLAWLRSLTQESRVECLREVFAQLRIPATASLPNTMLSWEEIRRMSKHGIDFGAHTITHPVLSKISVAQLREEICGSKRTVEERLQRPVRHFAYPFGKPADVGVQAKQIVQEAGFQSAVTTVFGVNGPRQDRFELRRFGIREADRGLFALKLDLNRMKIGENANPEYAVQGEEP